MLSIYQFIKQGCMDGSISCMLLRSSSNENLLLFQDETPNIVKLRSFEAVKDGLTDRPTDRETWWREAGTSPTKIPNNIWHIEHCTRLEIVSGHQSITGAKILKKEAKRLYQQFISLARDLNCLSTWDTSQIKELFMVPISLFSNRSSPIF